MKNIFLIAIAITALCGCEQRYEMPPNVPMKISDMEYNQKDTTIYVNSTTESIAIGYHSNGKPLPKDGQPYPDSKYEFATEFHFYISKASTAVFGTHFTIDEVTNPANAFNVKYNKTESTGEYVIKLTPQAITKPLVIVILPTMQEDNTTPLTVHLVPEK